MGEKYIYLTINQDFYRISERGNTNSILWGTRFGRGYGPVERQNYNHVCETGYLCLYDNKLAITKCDSGRLETGVWLLPRKILNIYDLN